MYEAVVDRDWCRGAERITSIKISSPSPSKKQVKKKHTDTDSLAESFMCYY
jgi:hypothetical protein